MIDLKAILTEYADEHNFEFKELGDGKYGIDIAIRLKDGSYRHQFVWLWIVKGRGRGMDCVYFISRAGRFTPEINTNQLIRESGHGTYTTITVMADKDKRGNPCETIVVQASPVYEFLSKEEFLYILWEVADVADIIEKRHFGGDQN